MVVERMRVMIDTSKYMNAEFSDLLHKVGDVAFYMDSETEKLYWTKK